MKILHIITSLSKGGAESFLYKLIIQSQKFDKDIKISVITLMNKGYYGDNLIRNKIDVYSLGLKNKFLFLLSIKKFIKLVKKIDPDIMQTWMYHSNFYGGIIGKFLGIKKIIWSIRHGQLFFLKSNLITILINCFSIFLSNYIPSKIVYCSDNSKNIHEKLGYNKKISRVIYNGFDFNEFYIDYSLRNETKNKFKIDDDMYIISMVARFNKQKNHRILLESIKILKDKNIKFKLLLIGKDINHKNMQLIDLINKLGISKSIILLDHVMDINKIYNITDLLVLPSKYGESFPNVIPEAMLCGVKCISSNLGEASTIIGQYGIIIDSLDKYHLYKLIFNEINFFNEMNISRKKKLQLSRREHIKDNFNIQDITNKYIDMWLS